MDNTKNIKWSRIDGNELLMAGNQVLINLKVSLEKDSLCVIQNTPYTIKRQGIWQQHYIMYQQNTQVLKMAFHFWGSKGSVYFKDGTFIHCDYKVSGGMKIRFFYKGHEIITYQYTGKHNRREILFHMENAFLDAEKLLLLSAMGKYLLTAIYQVCNDESALNILLLSV